MNVLIRTDCSTTIGMGHLMRCMALACILKKYNVHVVFVISELFGNRADYIQQKGFSVYILNEQVSWKDDAEATINIIKKYNLKPEWIVIDHYKIDAQWEACLRHYTKKIMVIDDLANRPHDCDLLLDQNFYLDSCTRYTNLIATTTKKLLGPAFAMLRPDFLQHRKIAKKRQESVQKILIFFGGGDYFDETMKVLSICPQFNCNIEFDIVIGNACRQKEKIEQFCVDFPRANYFCQIDNVAELMVSADLAIGGGGSTIWERCCLGLPSIVLTVADNQVAVARDVSSLGVLKYLGSSHQVSENELTDSVLEFLNDSTYLYDMSSKAHMLVDGMGCERIITTLLGA